MERGAMQDMLAKKYMRQSMGVPEDKAKDYPNYNRIMKAFDYSSDTMIANMLNYVDEHPLSIGDSLGDLYHLESKWRNIDSFKSGKKIDTVEPYSIEMLLNL